MYVIEMTQGIFNCHCRKKHEQKIEEMSSVTSTLEAERNSLQVKFLGIAEQHNQLSSQTKILQKELQNSEEKRVLLESENSTLRTQVTAMTRGLPEVNHFDIQRDLMSRKDRRHSGARLEEVAAERDKFRRQKEAMMRTLTERNISIKDLKAQVCIF